jgi:hypothetical protein
VTTICRSLFLGLKEEVKTNRGGGGVRLLQLMTINAITTRMAIYLSQLCV